MTNIPNGATHVCLFNEFYYKVEGTDILGWMPQRGLWVRSFRRISRLDSDFEEII